MRTQSCPPCPPLTLPPKGLRTKRRSTQLWSSVPKGPASSCGAHFHSCFFEPYTTIQSEMVKCLFIYLFYIVFVLCCKYFFYSWNYPNIFSLAVDTVIGLLHNLLTKRAINCNSANCLCSWSMHTMQGVFSCKPLTNAVWNIPAMQKPSSDAGPFLGCSWTSYVVVF